LKAKYEISPLDGIKNRVGSAVEVVYARGYVGEVSATQDGLKSGQDLSDTRSSAELMDEAVKVAKEADYVIFVGGLNKHDHQDSEGSDRTELGLPYGQDALISALAKATKNLVVVIISGNAVAMPWVNEVPAILEAWYSGSEAGNALARVLVGDVNPSGKLPFTFPVKLTDVGAHALGDFPGSFENETYKEGLFVGYRWFDKNKIKPLFPFGHGLSYTTFAYGKVSADKSKIQSSDQITVSVPVKNTGKRAGAEIVQLYVSDKQSYLPRPEKELKGFKKVWLNPGEETTVSITIDKSALSFFDDKLHEWVAEPGQFEALIGSSSAAIQGKVTFELQ
jgi:beta-glucosidase